MTIASEVTRIKTNIAQAYTALEEKGATIPEVKNSDNLSDAIGSITTGGATSGTMREFFAMPNSYLELDNEMTNDRHLASIRTRIDSNMCSVGCAFLPISGDSITVKYNDGIRAVKLSDGQYKELAANETLTLTWDSENDAADGYRWIIYYFVGPNLFSSTNVLGSFSTLGYSETYRFIKYIAVNAVIKDFSFLGQLGSMAGRGLDTFRTIGDGYVKASIMSSFSIYQSFPIRYIPSISDGYLKIEDGYSITKDNTTSSSSYYLTNYPTGLDLSGINSGTWDITNFGSRLMSLYVKIPPVDIIIATSSYPTKISKKNWKYIAENAPNVSGKTLTMGTANIATCGGENSEIITTLKNKGWTIA